MAKRLCLALMMICLFAAVNHAQKAQKLESGKAIEREIAGGAAQTYKLKLQAGQFLRVIVEQKSIDVALALVGADGKQLIESDLTGIIGAREPLSFEAKAAGAYRLMVRAKGAATLSGAYQTLMELNVSAEAKTIGDYRMRAGGAATQGGTYRALMELKATASEQDRKRMAAEQLLTEAAAMSRRMDFQPSIEKQQQALMLWREIGDRGWEGDTLRSIGGNYENLGSYDKAAEHYEQALAVAREIKDRGGEADSLSDLGLAYDRLGRYEKSLAYFVQALAINREVKNRREEGVSLCWIGWVNYRLKHHEKAVEYSEQALAIAREVKNRNDEGEAINILARAYWGLRQYEKAVEYGEQYLALKRELKSRVGEVAALHNLSFYYGGLFRIEKRIECLEQALVIYREMKARQREALVLKNLGDIYVHITRLDKAVESYEQAAPIYRELKDRPSEAFVLGPLANAYSQLGRQDKAIEYFEQALAINREIKSSRAAGNLNGLGNAYQSLGRYEKAIELYEQALAVSRENKQTARGWEAMVIGNIGETYQLQGRNDKAIEYLQQALTIYRETKFRGSETYTLKVLGDAFRAQAQYSQAVQHHEQALGFAREMRTRDLEGRSLHGLMLDWQAQRKPGLAVFYGKQAVNLYQEIRGEITTLDRESQQSFVKSKEETYRTLADLLIGEGRLPEAEQIIGMLKQEEYFEFVRRDSASSPEAGKAQLTPEEAALEKRYREISDHVAELGTERGVLINKSNRTPEEEQRMAKLDAELVVAGDAFQKFLDQLGTELSNEKEGSAKVYQLRESQGMMEDLRELGAGTVALYTLVTGDKYRLILTTPDFQKGYEHPIKAADLNRKVLEFRETLQSPKNDPLPLAQELYKILLGPVAGDLEKAKAKTIMWSLDGVLRYVPVSALHDGKQYMVERFNNVVFTPASQARLKDVPAERWDVLGLGVTKGHGENMPALPGVADEMRGIVRTESATGAESAVKQVEGKQAGVLPGVVMLDEQFTQQAMLSELRKRHKVVHIASHFQFSPGNETNSALLLGDGQFLSLAQIKTLPNVFGGVELLTLSACNTATGGAANGKEVEGFAVLAQRQGAKAVVASLWPVADGSTKFLMQEFYRLRESQPGTTKADALRQAQLSLLRGTASDTGASAQRGLTVGASTNGETFAHPYFWAPFILIGNWR
ncbi:MAG: tetratricopeptide repeat protein [Rubrivivax sp.]|nr:tetratricopeptide repeat protein [Pyrinomonadaceae bacterium]